jgi:hypothetical protein
MAKSFAVRAEGCFKFAGLCEMGIQSGDEVAGVSRHHQVLLRSLGFSLDHIGELNKMILHALEAIETSSVGRLDNGLKIPNGPREF